MTVGRMWGENMKAYEKILTTQEELAPLNKDLITPMVASIIDGVIDAHKEACVRGIEANAVLISDKLFFSTLTCCGVDIPMICGLKAFYTTELPKDVLFSVVQVPHLPLTQNEKLLELKRKNAKLKSILEEVNDLLAEDD